MPQQNLENHCSATHNQTLNGCFFPDSGKPNSICMYPYYLCENRLENFDNSLNSQMEIIGDRHLNEMFLQIITF